MTDREPDMFDGGAFGSLIAFLISGGYQRVETLNPDARYRYYTQCRLCGRTDEAREHYKTSSELVEHNEVCTLGHFLPRLRALADAGILPSDAQLKLEASDAYVQARAQERERCAVELEAEAILVEPEEAPIWEHCASYIRALPDPTSEEKP